MRTDVRTEVRVARAASPRPAIPTAGGWVARRWYYTPKTRRAYSVRQVSPGDRRLLAEFAMSLGQASSESEREAVTVLSDMLFDRVLGAGNDLSVAYAALESTAAGDRVIGAAAYAPATIDEAAFAIADAEPFRGEQVGRTLLSTLVRHAKRVGIRQIRGETTWSNRPMQLLAQAVGFGVEAAEDRTRRNLVFKLS